MAIPVLHLTTRFHVGGSERQFIERLRVQAEGFAPLVGCFELAGGDLDDFLELGLPAPEVFPLRGTLLRPNTLVQVARIAMLIRKRQVALVHGTDFVSNLLGLCAARAAGVRAVVSRVDLGHLRPGFGPRHRSVERWVSRAADAVCANAEAVRKLCLDEEGCAPEKVRVVRNGIDLRRFDRLAAQPLQHPLPEGRPLVAVVANLWPVKGHRGLIEAIARLHAARPDVCFALVGGVPELVAHGETGLLAPPGDPAALAARLVELLSDPRRAAEMGARGRARAERELTLEHLARGHGALYRSVLCLESAPGRAEAA